MARTAGYCDHGARPGSGGVITIDDAREAKATKHEERCKNAVLFNHHTMWGRVVCCATCGRKVC